MVLKHKTVNNKLINYSRLSDTHHTKFLQEIKENIYFTFIEMNIYLKNSQFHHNYNILEYLYQKYSSLEFFYKWNFCIAR